MIARGQIRREILPDYSRSKITVWIKSSDTLINKEAVIPKGKVN